MSTELALEQTEETNKITSIDSSIVTPMSMLQSARSQGASLEQMQQLMEMQFKWEENEARKAYFKAVAEFKMEQIVVSKDKKNSQYGSRYTGKGNLVNTVNPILAKYGLSANWSIDQSGGITVTCVLSHSQGHSEQVTMSAPPDKSGAKNPIQEIKSTKTYLEIATYESVTGVASFDDPGDNDGNGATAKLINAAQIKALDKLITEKEADKAAFLHHFGIEKIDDLPINKFPNAKKMLEAKK